MLAQADAGMWAAARSMAEGEEPEAEDHELDSEPVVLKVHRPERAPPIETREILKDVELLGFDEELLAKLFANLAARGMTLADLAN